MTLTDVGPTFALGSYFVFGSYLCLMLVIAIRGFLLKRKSRAFGGEAAEMKTHFVANRDFGPLVIFLNILATFVGGIMIGRKTCNGYFTACNAYPAACNGCFDRWRLSAAS